MNWDKYSPTWRQYLKELQPCDSSQAHKPPGTSPPNVYIDVDAKEYVDMEGFQVHAAHVMIWSRARDTDVIVGYPQQYRILVTSLIFEICS